MAAKRKEKRPGEDSILFLDRVLESVKPPRDPYRLLMERDARRGVGGAVLPLPPESREEVRQPEDLSPEGIARFERDVRRDAVGLGLFERASRRITKSGLSERAIQRIIRFGVHQAYDQAYGVAERAAPDELTWADLPHLRLLAHHYRRLGEVMLDKIEAVELEDLPGTGRLSGNDVKGMGD